MTTPDEQAVERVEVDGGKYTVVLDMKNFRALRYGDEWQDLTGNNLVFHLAYELAEARAAIAAIPDTKALVEVLEYLDKAGGLGLGKHKLIRAAIAAAKETA